MTGHLSIRQSLLLVMMLFVYFSSLTRPPASDEMYDVCRGATVGV
jgi:hypothetical protein